MPLAVALLFMIRLQKISTLPQSQSTIRKMPRQLLALFVSLSVLSMASAAPALKFDVVTFCCPCSVDSHICQAQFDHLNFPTTNGHYIAMGSDAHRLDLATNGNALAIYYNTLNDGWTTNSGAQQAAIIDQYAVSGFTTTGPKPNWVILNEISAGLWPSDSSYRSCVHDVVHALATTYGYNVILYSPFANPGANASDWQAVSADAYIGIENYLSGAEVMAQSFSVSWCQSQYQSSITSYTGLGVARSKLMLGEEFSQTTNGVSYGRAGVSSNEWDSVILARNQAAQNVSFAGFLSYAWSGNAMLVTDDELIHYEDTYRSNHLPSDAPLAPPFVLLQPQSQTAPVGANVSFIVFPAGNAPTTFQWRFNGTNIPGATASSLNVSNIQPANGGNYSVLLGNAAGSTPSSNALLTVQVPPPLAFEPFAPAITTYAAGTNLIGQTNAAGRWWSQAGPTNSIQPMIISNSLSIAGLAAASGNSVLFGNMGTSARFNIGTTINSGTVYYSFIFKITDTNNMNTSGVFWAGLNNSVGFQTNTPTSVGTRVLTRVTAGGYNIGLDKSSGTASNFVFVSNTFTQQQVVFVVGSYQFNPAATNDDVSQLWINPDPSTFGNASPPSASLTNSPGTDISQVASFVLFDRNASEPAGIVADEIRVGTNWASVTPPGPAQTVIPTIKIALANKNVVLSWTTNAPGFTLETTPALTNPVVWAAITNSFPTVADQFVYTNPASAGNSYFRLRK